MATCRQCVSREIVTCITRATAGHVFSVLALTQLRSPFSGSRGITGIFRETVASDARHATYACTLLKNDLDQSITVGHGINFSTSVGLH